ncbi:hypothetical protein MKW98_022534 [Papaver atlanticum]|uniref:Uncharacterized protein n=1 Tax=Papaver atlanticum TaxID=357466 RepID=A0AAD4SMJ3_9MAGN|nr:hypothetical protein MKW98_022534 [Papaver atlanticum]
MMIIKVALESLTAELKDVVDCVNKMKPDEDLLKPSSDYTYEIDADSEVIPIESKLVNDFTLHSYILIDSNLAYEGNCKSTTKTQISHMYEAGFEVEVQKYNGDSTFLACQEGKPFISTHDFLNIFVESQETEVRVHRQSNYNTLNMLPSDWKFITDDDLNQFTSYIFKILKVFSIGQKSRITSLTVVSPSYEYVRMLFYCGKELEVIIWYGYGVINYDRLYLDAFCCVTILNWFILMHNYKANVDYKLIIDLGYELKLFFANLNWSLNVKEGDSGNTRRLLDKMLQQVIILWTISTLQKTRERKLGNAQDMFEKLLVKDFRLLTYIKVFWKGFEVIEIAATRCKLVILIVFILLVFLSKSELTWFSFNSWNIGKYSGYIWLEPKNGLYVKMETNNEQYLCSYYCEVFSLEFDCFQQLQLMLNFPMKYVMKFVITSITNTRRGNSQYKEVSKLQYNLDTV